MVKIYNFSRLIKKYSKGKTYVIEEEKGYYDMEQGGIYIKGKSTERLLYPCAILPLSNEDLKFIEGGSYNNESRKIYCYENLQTSTKIRNIMNNKEEKEYTIFAYKNYSDFDNSNNQGLYIYYLNRVGDSIGKP